MFDEGDGGGRGDEEEEGMGGGKKAYTRVNPCRRLVVHIVTIRVDKQPFQVAHEEFLTVAGRGDVEVGRRGLRVMCGCR